MVNMVKLHPLSDLIICVVNQNGESKKAFYEFKRDDIQFVFLCVLSICRQISDTVSLSGYKTTFSNHKKPRPISNAEFWDAFSGTIREKDFHCANNKKQNSL